MSETLQEYQKRMSYENRVRTQALAILQRAKRAGIPDENMRICKDEFKKLLSPEFHKDVEGFSEKVYENADRLFDFKYITIDGGSIRVRRKAGFALLFRLIACDKIGHYISFNSLAHNLENAHERNDYIKQLKTYDVLYLSEFKEEGAKTQWLGFDAGGFYDELFEHREDSHKPTIISFINPINANNSLKTNDFGYYLADLSKETESKKNHVLRIKVRG